MLGQLRDRPVALQTYDMLVREEAASPDPKERENLLAQLATTSTEDPPAALIDFAAAIDALTVSEDGTEFWSRTAFNNNQPSNDDRCLEKIAELNGTITELRQQIPVPAPTPTTGDCP